jgi:pyridoxine/pyridoxamine 5'-phosphate oxidase
MKNLSIEASDSIGDIWLKVTDQLKNLKTDLNSSNKTLVLSTLSDITGPESRIVVLRDIVFKPLSFMIFTDCRSPKISEVTANPMVSILHYDVALKRQLRCKAVASIITDQWVLAKYWEDHKVKSKDYSTVLPPSAEILNPEAIKKELNDAFKNFAVVELKIEQLEVLEIGRENHLRLKFHLGSEGFYTKASWLVP